MKGAFIALLVAYVCMFGGAVYLGESLDTAHYQLKMCQRAKQSIPPVGTMKAEVVKDCVFNNPCQFMSLRAYQKKVRALAGSNKSLRRLHDA